MGDRENLFYAYYDLVVSPLSYDFVGFLVAAENARRQTGYAEMHIVIVPFEAGVGQINNEQYGIDHAMWRLTNIVTPLTRMLPSCSGYSICSTRSQARDLGPWSIAGDPAEKPENVYPTGYTIERPIERHHTGWSVLAAHKGDNLQYLRATPESRSYARQWINQHAGGKKCVAITLREARFTHSRNTNIYVWSAFAKHLKEQGFFPIIFRDIDTALKATPKEFDGIEMFPEGVFNLELRMGLYEEAHACAFVANGPAQVCFYNRNVRFIYLVTGDWLEKTPSPFNRIGIDFGETPPLANHYQRWIWQEQTSEILIREFKTLDGLIDHRQQNGTFEAGLEPIAENRISLERMEQRYWDWARRSFFTSAQEIELAKACRGDDVPDDYYENEDALVLVDQALNANDLDAASAHLTQIYENGGMTSDLHVKLGVIKEAMGKFEEAADMYVLAINAGAQSPAVYFRLAIANKNIGRTESAIRHLETMINNGAKSRYITYELGLLYEQVRSPERAIEFYEKSRVNGITSPEIELHRTAMSSQVYSNIEP